MPHPNSKMAMFDELEVLLNEDISSVTDREQAAFDRLAAPFDEKAIVLFGAGQLGRKTLAGLRKLGTEPLAFSDNNPHLWNQSIDGLIVLSPQEAAQKYREKAVFVVTIWSGNLSGYRLAQTRDQLLALKCSKVISFGFLFWKYAEIFLPYYCLDLPHKVYQQSIDIKNAFSLWADDQSRYVYTAQLKWRMLLDFDGLPGPASGQPYFPLDIFSLSEEEVFVDCGAYDGDTIKDFLQLQKSFAGKIIALEPDPQNFLCLQNFASTLPVDIKKRVTVLPLAAGRQGGKLRFEAMGTESSNISDTGDMEVYCLPLDEVLSDCIPTFLKMDIEGAEMDALAGARKVIRDTTPILAICVYHRQDDLWQIPLFIQSLSDQYRFFLRPYLEAGWDSICYAVPVNRLIV